MIDIRPPHIRNRHTDRSGAPLRRREQIWRALRREDGVTLIVTLGLMLVASMIIGSAFIANVSEVHLSNRATQQRKAYYAAQAGISWYLFHLSQNGAFLTYCTEPPGMKTEENPLNQFYKAPTGRVEKTSSELNKITVPGSTEEQFAIQLVPETSAPTTDEQCDQNKLYETMLEKSGHWKGTFRIRSTGFSGGEKRTIVATFKNEGFLDFVYYTTYETKDPATYPAAGHTVTEAEKECNNVLGKRASWCVSIYFASGDEVKGPMHTEDHASISGSPVFGREIADPIEFGTAVTDGCGSPDTGYSEAPGGTGCGSPTFKGTHVPVKEVKSIQPPPSDNELVKWGENGGTLLKGYKEVILEETKITIKKPGTSETGEVKEWPTDGVLYVENEGACSEEYHQYHAYYPGSATCGNVFVRGKYKRSLTIGAANSIIIDGSLLSVPNTAGVPEGTPELGLIANSFVRIYHPVAHWAGKCTESGGKCVSCPGGTVINSTEKKCEYENSAEACNAASIEGAGSGENTNPLPGTEGTMKEPILDAGILALGHSFAVDNSFCPEGSPEIGTLTVHGAIAQKYRGIVGRVGGPGYIKGYEYDNRLQAGEPPHFLNPVQAPWKIERETLSKSP
jgi:hypothetical protein